MDIIRDRSRAYLPHFSTMESKLALTLTVLGIMRIVHRDLLRVLNICKAYM